jgi:hypothetical protein
MQLAYLAGAALGALALAGTSAAPVVSSNWSGYAVTAPLAFTHVQGSWRVPAVTCGPGDAGAASSAWVGLGGYTRAAGTLQQIGVDARCGTRGRPVYRAWWEVLPAAAVPLQLEVRPGDRITASVVANPAAVELTIADERSGASVTKTMAAAGDVTHSAEWIVEAPSLCSRIACRTLPLANFGAVTFTGARATAEGQAGPIADPRWTHVPIRLAPGTDSRAFPAGPEPQKGVPPSTAGSDPGRLTPDGTSFSVRWRPFAV